MATVTITANCEKCGKFEVQRKRYPRQSTSGTVSDLPGNVVCPACRMWATIIKVQDHNDARMPR